MLVPINLNASFIDANNIKRNSLHFSKYYCSVALVLNCLKDNTICFQYCINTPPIVIGAILIVYGSYIIFNFKKINFKIFNQYINNIVK